MKSKCTAAVLLLLCCLAIAISPSRAGAQAVAAGGIDVVQAAYDQLLSLYYEPLDPPTLLSAGWDALGRAAAMQGLPAPSALPSLPEDQDAAFAAFSSAYNGYLAQIPSNAVATNLAFAIGRGMASSLNESHTNFLPPASYRSFLASLGSGDLPVGLGVRIAPSPPWLVSGVAPNGPAATAGIAAGDVIVAADGTDLSNAARQTFDQALGGDDGTTHVVTVSRNGQQLQLSVTRGTYYFPPLTTKMLNGGVGYIELDHFSDAGLTLPDGTELLSSFDDQVNGLIAAGATGLVLDLRGNGGGDTLAAEEILGRFLPSDTETVLRFDERGHAATGLVAGAMFAKQLPMVVVVDQDSASSSEVVASTLKEDNRAILVGARTAGALATSEILPLPEGAGMQIAVAEQVSARDGVQIDGVGVPVDVEVPGLPVSDQTSGQDPQLDAAIAELADAPAPPSAETPQRASKSELNALLSPYMPDPTQIPQNDRLSAVVRTETLDISDPNEWLDTFGFGGRDPKALQQTLRSRGWIGSHLQNYNSQPLVPPTVSVVIDLYATAQGAEQAVTTNDFPDQQQLIPPPVQLGDDISAARGIWLGLGGISLSWRHGNVVLNVGYGDVPGYERTDVLVAVAKAVDAAYLAHPITSLPPSLAPSP